jgi:hypothetical protein
MTPNKTSTLAGVSSDCGPSGVLCARRLSADAIPRIVAMLALLLLHAASAAAQQSFAELQWVLRPGDRVSVIDNSGIETRGRVEAIDVGSLRIAVNGDVREWSVPAVWQVRRRGDSLKSGTIIGLAIGACTAVAGGLAYASLLHNEGHDAVGPFMFLVGVGAGGGAAIGAGFDALIRDHSVIYQSRSRVALVRSVTRHARSLQLAVRF